MTLLNKATHVLSAAYGGEHHIPGVIKDHGRTIECNVFDKLSTYDNTVLTRLVIGCHDQCIRMEIQASCPGRVKLLFSDRQRPEKCGDFPIMLGHVTIEQAVDVYRNGERGQQFPK